MSYTEFEPYTGNKYLYPFYKIYELTGLFMLGFTFLTLILAFRFGSLKIKVKR